MAVRWSRWSPQLALAPAVLVTLIAFFGSIGWTIFMSMTRSRRFPEYFFDPAEWGRQYNRLFKDDVWEVALRNLVILGIGSCLAIVFGFILAALIDREKRGENVFRGYYKDPSATAAAFTEDGWFCTGDVGRWTEDGFLQIVDRKKDILVNSGGKNIPPANIEAKFVDDPVIERLVVYGDARPYLVAAVWVRPEVPADERSRLVTQRIDEINAHLARHETIKRHFIADRPLAVEDGTLTSSLKLRRKAVYDRLRERFEGLYA